MIWIAVDAMGGDEAPRNIVDGALAAVRHFDLGVLLVGAAPAIEAELDRRISRSDVDRRAVRVIDAPDVVTMEESPVAALRRKPAASIRVAADAVARGEASALFSAGHTGATVMAAHGAFGMLPGIDRPALAATIPTRRRPAVLLDVGASAECRPQHLLQFAVMGEVYTRVVLGNAVAAHRAALDRRRGHQGQRADARGAPAAEGGAAEFRRQRRGARRLQRRCRRDCLRRLHRQRRAEDQRGAGRGRRRPVERGAVEHDHHAGRVRS